MTPYAKILNRLLSANISGGMKLGLNNCLELDRLLGHPARVVPAIHVAGTNGKGSVSTKIAAACQAAGKKTGLFTSPHLSCFRERIRIDGQMISEDAVQKHLERIFSICEQNGLSPTFFELTTMLAFLHFDEEHVDAAVLEVGLGGRLDATNICRPMLSVITSISLEHTEILGDTLEAIAKEKGGIIKAGVPVVIGPKVPKNVIESIAEEKGSRCIPVSGNFEEYHTENCAIARCACKELGLPEKAIEEGLKAVPPCRLEAFDAIILDVAHNPEGLRQLVAAVHHWYDVRPLRFVLGLSSNKDVDGCLQAIQESAAGFHLVEGSNGRAASKELLAEKLLKLGVEQENVMCEESVGKALENACRSEEMIVVCGTFFIMAEARKWMGIKEPQDPIDMNERL